MKASWRKRISSLLLLTLVAWMLIACGSGSTASAPTNACSAGNSTASSSTPRLSRQNPMQVSIILIH